MAVKSFMSAGLQAELIELLEKIVLQNTNFASNHNLQNLLIITAIKVPTFLGDFRRCWFDLRGDLVTNEGCRIWLCGLLHLASGVFLWRVVRTCEELSGSFSAELVRLLLLSGLWWEVKRTVLGRPSLRRQGLKFSEEMALRELVWVHKQADKSRVKDYIHRLDKFDGPAVGEIAVGYELYDEAFEIYKKFDLKAQAIKVLLEHTEDLNRALEYASKVCSRGSLFLKGLLCVYTSQGARFCAYA